jgi:hypothetical protein
MLLRPSIARVATLRLSKPKWFPINLVVHHNEVLHTSSLLIGGRPASFGARRFQDETILFQTLDPRGALHRKISAVLSFGGQDPSPGGCILRMR